MYYTSLLFPLYIVSSALTVRSPGTLITASRVLLSKGFKGFSVKNEKLFVVNPTSLDNVSVIEKGRQ